MPFKSLLARRGDGERLEGRGAFKKHGVLRPVSWRQEARKSELRAMGAVMWSCVRGLSLPL